MLIRRLYDRPVWGWRNPSMEMDAIKREIDKVFRELYEGRSSISSAGVFPLVNVIEERENFIVKAEVPGISFDEINVSVTKNTLSIEGKRKTALDEEGIKYHRREREEGSFSRMISLPSEIDSEKVSARTVNGELTITLPKAEKAKARQITIKTS